jgi:hypothetical protein
MGLGRIAAAGIVGAMVVVFVGINSDAIASWFRRLFRMRLRPLRRHRSFGALRQAILGTNKHTVAEVLGPPPAAGVVGKTTAQGQAHYWYAGTWYYPLDPGESSAIAIEFVEGVATKVDVIRPPQNTRSA